MNAPWTCHCKWLFHLAPATTLFLKCVVNIKIQAGWLQNYVHVSVIYRWIKKLNVQYLFFPVKNNLNHYRITVPGRLTIQPLFLSIVRSLPCAIQSRGILIHISVQSCLVKLLCLRNLKYHLDTDWYAYS